VAADDAAAAIGSGAMTSLAGRRLVPGSGAQALVLAGLGAAAVVFGALVAVAPLLALAVPVAAGAAALAFLAPAANFTLLVFLTAIVPYGLQNRYGLGGGQGVPGLLASDLVLILGLAWAAVALGRAQLDRRSRIVCVALLAFLALGAVQALHGLMQGRGISDVGAEYRVFLVLGGAAMIALPLLLEAGSRRRLVRGMALLGLALGLWALIQWTVDIPFAEAGDAGVREGILQTTAGRGQIQGGLFSFPVATIMAAAVLVAGVVASRLVQALLACVVLLNLAGLLLTYERTFWVATVIGVLLVVAGSPSRGRLRALFWGPLAIVVFFAVMSTVAPDTLGAARERLLSLGRYQSDNSLRYRLTESDRVLDEIEKRPLTGSGLAATIYWGRPWEDVPPDTHTFAHNGYLWVTWKLGLLGAALLFGAMLFVLIGRAPPAPSPLAAALRIGARAGLLALLLSSVTFPSFTQLSSAAVLGLLLALAVAPMRAPYPAAARSAGT
jgi:hypothetical protein